MTAIVICLFLIFLASAQVYSFHSIIQKVSTHHASLKFFDLRKSDSVFLSNRLRSKSPVLNENDSECAELKKSPLKIIAPLLSFSVIVAAFVAFPVHPAFADSYLETLKTTASESGLVQSFLLIFISELGDKTFFIAALLAAKYGRLISFTGSIGALAAMTVISTILGQVFHAIPSSLTQGIPFDDYIAVAAFTYFGLKTLFEASKLEPGDSSGMDEEKAEAEEIVEEVTADQKRKSVLALVLQTFSLVFAAEIGDRSFLSTIALSAALNPYAVALGATAAHASATGLAVLGGSFMSKFLSEKVIGYVGGSLFLVFAATTAFGIF